jgi:tungstate transport system substrate-binding protein
MYNDFVIVGPSADPAGAKAKAGAIEAFQAIAAAEAPFVSRGDDSGTHKMELALWKDAGVEPAGDWYRAVGQGMGAALNTAAGMNAYILADRASWLNFGNKADLAIDFEGDPVLFNQYAYLPVNPEKHPHVKADLVAQLEDWLVSDTAKGLIEGYKIADQQLFVFNAQPK